MNMIRRELITKHTRDTGYPTMDRLNYTWMKNVHGKVIISFIRGGRVPFRVSYLPRNEVFFNTV